MDKGWVDDGGGIEGEEGSDGYSRGGMDRERVYFVRNDMKTVGGAEAKEREETCFWVAAACNVCVSYTFVLQLEKAGDDYRVDYVD